MGLSHSFIVKLYGLKTQNNDFQFSNNWSSVQINSNAISRWWYDDDELFVDELKILVILILLEL